MKRTVSLLVAVVLMLSLASCAGNNPSTSQPSSNNSASTTTASTATTDAKTEEPTPEQRMVEGKTNITFWHSMGGAGGEGIKKMVEDFNAQSDTINVIEIFQGNYDDAITKLKSSVASGQGPEIMQLYDIGTRWMIDSGYAVDMQTVLERDGYDLSQIEPNIAAYYTVGDKLYSMPFNSSTPIMYYNKDAFTAAGLDPENPPANFDELETAATALTKENAPGMTMRVYSWLFEQYCSKQGKMYANNGNGRDDKATAVEFDGNGAGAAFLAKINDFTKKGICGNLGRDDAAILNAFGAGQTAIIFGSTASLPSIVGAVNGAFALGTAPLPDLIAGTNGGVSIGGGSLWIMDKGDDASKDAAWQFIKYAVSPEVQVYWHKQTGYFPITTKAYELEEMKEQMANNPLFVTAIDQLHASPTSARGALLGVFTEARGILEANWEDMLADKLTPEQAVEESAKAINAAIEQYNIAND